MVRPLQRAALSLSLLTALSLISIVPAVAQKPIQRDFLMKLAGMTGRDQVKIVRASINDQDPSALVSIDPPTQEVKIRTIVSLDRPALETGFAPYGVSIISLEPIATPLLSARASAADGIPGFPVFIDTGDPVNDEAVYQSNKAAWIEAHPDLYPPAPDATVPSPR
jgi:hypothetical protein